MSEIGIADRVNDLGATMQVVAPNLFCGGLMLIFQLEELLLFVFYKPALF